MVNKAILVGNVGADPEVRTTESGIKVARVRLATSERILDKNTNEYKDLTEWHTVVMWRNLADVVDKYVRKGSQLYVEGSIRNREWTDRDNNKRYSVEIVANEMKLLGRRSDSAAPAAAPTAHTQPAAAPQQSVQQPSQPSAPASDIDDLPF